MRHYYAKIGETRADEVVDEIVDEVVDKVVEHVWLEVVEASEDSVRGRRLEVDRLRAVAADVSTTSAVGSLVTAPIARLSDWVVTGVTTPRSASPIEVGPQAASILTT
jgi:enoyl reductase-like protein